MNPRRLSVLPLAAVLAALSLPAFADDAATAAAAMQAMGQAVPGGAPPSGSMTEKKKDSGGFRELQAPKIEKKAGGAKSSAKKSKAKSTASKYKSTELAESDEHHYRFNENGEPIVVPKKKAAADKKKKASSESSDESKDEKPAVCADEEPCPARSSDADAL